MNQRSHELSRDLSDIRAQLGRAIRRDHERRQRRRTQVRAATIVVVLSTAVSGTALAAGELTGAIDLGGGHSATPVRQSPSAVDPRLPYEYRVAGVHRHNDQRSGTVLIESSRPLGELAQSALTALRLACANHATTVDGAVVWVFDATCMPARPGR